MALFYAPSFENRPNLSPRFGYHASGDAAADAAQRRRAEKGHMAAMGALSVLALKPSGQSLDSQLRQIFILLNRGEVRRAMDRIDMLLDRVSELPASALDRLGYYADRAYRALAQGSEYGQAHPYGMMSSAPVLLPARPF